MKTLLWETWNDAILLLVVLFVPMLLLVVLFELARSVR